MVRVQYNIKKLKISDYNRPWFRLWYLCISTVELVMWILTDKLNSSYKNKIKEHLGKDPMSFENWKQLIYGTRMEPDILNYWSAINNNWDSITLYPKKQNYHIALNLSSNYEVENNNITWMNFNYSETVIF